MNHSKNLQINLQEKLKAAADVDAVAAIAKEAGFSISADDLKKAQSEFSDEELEDAAGGTEDCVNRSSQAVPCWSCRVASIEWMS